LFAASAMFYFPGIVKHQGLRFYLAYQKRFGEAGFYSNRIAFARGYSGFSYNNVFSYKVDYKLPLAYPDFNLSSLIYIKRIALAVFYDEVINLEGNKENYRSIGNDLLFDIHFFRSFVPFEIGLRSVYMIEDKATCFGFLGSIRL